jgi:hypothetical protein
MKDGQEKTRWVNVGVILEKNGKEFMLIDPTINFAAFPREQGKDMVMVGIFDDANQNNQGGQQPQQNQSYQQPQQNQSYQQPQQNQSYQQPVQEYQNVQGQKTDANGNLLPY